MEGYNGNAARSISGNVVNITFRMQPAIGYPKPMKWLLTEQRSTLEGEMKHGPLKGCTGAPTEESKNCDKEAEPQSLFLSQWL